MSCMPSVSQVEFSRQAKAPQPTWRALLRQRATSAVGTQRTNHQQGNQQWVDWKSLLITQGLPEYQQKKKRQRTKEGFHTLVIHKRHTVQYSHLGQTVTWLEIGHLAALSATDIIWHHGTFLLAGTHIPLFGCFQHKKYQIVSWKLLAWLQTCINIHLFCWHSNACYRYNKVILHNCQVHLWQFASELL